MKKTRRIQPHFWYSARRILSAVLMAALIVSAVGTVYAEPAMVVVNQKLAAPPEGVGRESIPVRIDWKTTDPVGDATSESNIKDSYIEIHFRTTIKDLTSSGFNQEKDDQGRDGTRLDDNYHSIYASFTKKLLKNDNATAWVQVNAPVLPQNIYVKNSTTSSAGDRKFTAEMTVTYQDYHTGQWVKDKEFAPYTVTLDNKQYTNQERDDQKRYFSTNSKDSGLNVSLKSSVIPAVGNFEILYSAWALDQYGIKANLQNGKLYSVGLAKVDVDELMEISGVSLEEGGKIIIDNKAFNAAYSQPVSFRLKGQLSYSSKGGNTLDLYSSVITLTPTRFTVTYTDGVEGETLFEDQIHSNLVYGVSTPSFNGTPTRTGYTFAGWTPSVSETVMGSPTYTAKWTPITYSISYDLASGTVSGNPTSYTVESAPITLSNPTRAGYTFAGWTGTGLDEAAVSVVIPTGSTGDRNYTATWTPNGNTVYMVQHHFQNVENDEYTLDSNVDTLTGTTDAQTEAQARTVEGFTAQEFKQQTIAADGSTVIKVFYTRNSYAATIVNGTGSDNYRMGRTVTITAATPAEGQQFAGWTSNDGVSFADASSMTTTFTMPAKAVTVTANYEDIPPVEPAKYTVTVVGGSADKSAYAEGATVTITADAPAAGQQFAGWASNDGVSFADASAMTTTFTMPAKAVTVTANYEDIPPVEPAKYAVTVVGGSADESEYAEGETVAITADAPAAGQQFAGWTSNDGVSFADASAMSTTFTMPAKAVTVTASYEDIPAVTYTLTVNNGSGSGEYAAGTEIAISANTPEAGERFKEWTVPAGITFVSGGQTTAAGVICMPACDAELTAVFESVSAAVYTMRFDANGGSGVMNPIELGENAEITLPDCGFVRDGFAFIGWNEAADGSGKMYEPGIKYVLHGDETLYAVWQPAPAAAVPPSAPNVPQTGDKTHVVLWQLLLAASLAGIAAGAACSRKRKRG